MDQTKTIVKSTDASVSSASDEFNDDYYIEKDGVRQHKLNNTWVLWRHPVNSTDWSISGYQKVAVISTVEEFWAIYNILPTLVAPRITSSESVGGVADESVTDEEYDMWFLMREGIPPIWEHVKNSQGGAFKFRVHRSKGDNHWLTLSVKLVSE